MGSMYAWATPTHMLDYMTLIEIYMYHDHGIEFEKDKANILVSRIAVGLFGAEEPKKKNVSTTPDLAAFHKRYGDRIKTPNSEKGDV
ncbi:hypothetical protein [Sporosarcina sp. FSL K6-3457]|uniref:hypothetical protein n=1 Tax=Sporosarcina sp. FSL K6-3457 TaxID=2978204 RepID=UPI0030F96E29